MPTTKPPLSPTFRSANPVRRDIEMAWLGAHRHEYQGQWVAIDGDRLIAHGTDPDAVISQAKSQVSSPFFARIPADDSLPTVGGW